MLVGSADARQFLMNILFTSVENSKQVGCGVIRRSSFLIQGDQRESDGFQKKSTR